MKLDILHIWTQYLYIYKHENKPERQSKKITETKYATILSRSRMCECVLYTKRNLQQAIVVLVSHSFCHMLFIRCYFFCLSNSCGVASPLSHTGYMNSVRCKNGKMMSYYFLSKMLSDWRFVKLKCCLIFFPFFLMCRHWQLASFGINRFIYPLNGLLFGCSSNKILTCPTFECRNIIFSSVVTEEVLNKST